MQMEIQPLSSNHDTSSFNSQSDKLNNWLKSAAWSAHQKSTATVYVLTAQGNNKVLAYVATSAATVDATTVTNPGFQKKGKTQLSQAPAARIGKLAVDAKYHGRGLGLMMLMHACNKIVEASYLVGIQVLIVDAVNKQNVLQFYKEFGFVQLSTTDESSDTIPMALPIANLVAAQAQRPRHRTQSHTK